MNGACYWSNHQVPEKTDFNKTIPLVYRGDLVILFKYLVAVLYSLAPHGRFASNKQWNV